MNTSRQEPPRKRTGRTVRKVRATKTRLRERDTWILDALSRMRFLTTRQLADLYFAGSRWAANKRLRRLLDAGVIQAWVPKRDGENVYSLVPAGRTILRAEQDQADVAIHCPRGLDGQLDHLLAINHVRIALAMELPSHDAEILWWRSDWEIRAQTPSRAIPDASFTVSWSGCEECVFHLEVDHHTRTPRKFLTKLLRYGGSRLAGPGTTSATVLVIGTDPHCIERYRLGLESIRIRSAIYFSTFEATATSGVTGTIWRPAHDGAPLSLRELRFPPYGKEGGIAKSDGFPRACAPAAARTSLMETANESTRI